MAKRPYLCVKRKAEKRGYITEEEAASQFIHNPPSSTSKIEEPAPKAQQEIDRATEMTARSKVLSPPTIQKAVSTTEDALRRSRATTLEKSEAPLPPLKKPWKPACAVPSANLQRKG